MQYQCKNAQQAFLPPTEGRCRCLGWILTVARWFALEGVLYLSLGWQGEHPLLQQNTHGVACLVGCSEGQAGWAVNIRQRRSSKLVDNLIWFQPRLLPFLRNGWWYEAAWARVKGREKRRSYRLLFLSPVLSEPQQVPFHFQGGGETRLLAAWKEHCC